MQDPKMNARKGVPKKGHFRIDGFLQIPDQASLPDEVQTSAYVFDIRGHFLGRGEVNEKGRFGILTKLTKPADIQIYIGPTTDPQAVRKSNALNKKFSANEWKGRGNQYRLKAELALTTKMIEALFPWRICISGHVRKIHTEDDATEICPVPFVKVELFDVDREWCWWRYIEKWWPYLLDRRVFKIPELLKEPPFPPKPFPGPDPIGPVTESQRQPLQMAGMRRLGPQPEPPDVPPAMKAAQPLPHTRVGEARRLGPDIASRLDNLTLIDTKPPWILFPLCFYSRQRVCETFTDENGYFRCCFNWWPFQFRRGRLRLDLRPDIIIKVTQVIDGVETVLYMDPYTSTRWNMTNAHINLWLDNEEIACGSGDEQDRPEGAQVFFTRIGDTEVYKVNQTDGLLDQPPLSNLAFGRKLVIHGQFGDDVSDGTPVRYYRLSYAKHGLPDTAFVPITTPLNDTRVDKITNVSEYYSLGPQPVNGEAALFEVRNFEDYLWYHPDKIGAWYSWLAEADTSKYILRLEVFDQNGIKLTSAVIDYRDGTAAPNGVLPAMTDKCDLVLTLDNKAPELDLQIPAVINPCGVIPGSDVPPLDFMINVSQENGRLRRWRLQFTKGIDSTPNFLDGNISNNGIPGSVNRTVSGAPLLVDLSSTCAFALKLWARSHITDGRVLGSSSLPRTIYYREIIKAVAIEKCPPCPPCV